MKYQKSMMKIMENLLGDRTEKSAEKIIHETKTGRNSAFKAIDWLSKYGFISANKNGNQKGIRLVVDNYTLQFKYYLDSIRFKTIDPFVKIIAEIFISGISEEKIKSVLLFGSVLKKKEFNDIDILLLGDSIDLKVLESFSELKDKIERVFGVILNLHKGELNIENIFKGIIIYQSSFINFKSDIKNQYHEFMDWFFEAIKNSDSRDFKKIFDNSVLNLSYVYCKLNNFNPETKSDALEYFSKKYKVRNLGELKKAGVEIGKKIFK